MEVRSRVHGVVPVRRVPSTGLITALFAVAIVGGLVVAVIVWRERNEAARFEALQRAVDRGEIRRSEQQLAFDIASPPAKPIETPAPAMTVAPVATPPASRPARYDLLGTFRSMPPIQGLEKFRVDFGGLRPVQGGGWPIIFLQQWTDNELRFQTLDRADPMKYKAYVFIERKGEAFYITVRGLSPIPPTLLERVADASEKDAQTFDKLAAQQRAAPNKPLSVLSAPR